MTASPAVSGDTRSRGTAAFALIISVAALAVGLVNAIASARQRSRQEDAAVTGDLYPILRGLRDSAGQYAKPLGGQGNADLVAMHYGLIDLNDLRPAIRDKSLLKQVVALLEHDAADLAMSIDPPRFEGATFTDDALNSFRQFAEAAQAAVGRCQSLRRGATT